MKNLFHSKKEKITFWVSGYDYHTDNVKENINYLNENLDEFSNETNIPKNDIKSRVISSSRRYKYMRVFYANDNNCPKNAFEFGDKGDWTMWKWIED